jgi:hypothetical protein
LTKSIEVLALIALGAIALVLVSRKAFGSSGNPTDLPNLEDFATQTETLIAPSTTGVGAVGVSEGRAETANQVKSNIASSNLLTEQALRDLIAQDSQKQEVQTIQDGGTTVKTVQDRAMDISTPKSLSLFRSDTSELTVHDAFKPLGDASVLGVRGKLVGANAKARTEQTFSATIRTRDGGTRNVLVTAEALKRLQNNLISSSEV